MLYVDLYVHYIATLHRLMTNIKSVEQILLRFIVCAYSAAVATGRLLAYGKLPRMNGDQRKTAQAVVSEK